MDLEEFIGFFLPPGTLEFFTIQTIEVEEGEDFPIRGRKTTLLFRRRKWKVEGTA